MASSTPNMEETVATETEAAPVVSEMASSTPVVILEEEVAPAAVASSTPIIEETTVSEPEATAVAEEVIVSEPQPSPEATAGEAEIVSGAEETPAKEEDNVADIVTTEINES